MYSSSMFFFGGGGGGGIRLLNFSMKNVAVSHGLGSRRGNEACPKKNKKTN